MVKNSKSTLDRILKIDILRRLGGIRAMIFDHRWWQRGVFSIFDTPLRSKPLFAQFDSRWIGSSITVLLLVLAALLLPCGKGFGQSWFSEPEALHSYFEHDYIDQQSSSLKQDGDLSPDLATDGAGNWVAVWHMYEDKLLEQTEYDILVSHSSDNAATWSQPVRLYSGSANDWGDDLYPQVVTDGAGQWVVAWSSDDYSFNASIGGDSDILYSRSTDNGATWTLPAALNSDAATDPSPSYDTALGGDSSLRIASDGTGHMIAIWAKCTSDGFMGVCTNTNRLVSVSANAGASWSAATILQNGVGGVDSLAGSGDGTWLAATAGSSEITILRSVDNGSTWTAPILVPTPGTGNVGCDIATDGQGNWIVVCSSNILSPDNYLIYTDIISLRSTDNGVTWSAPGLLNNDAHSVLDANRYAQVVYDGSGHWVVVWNYSTAYAYGPMRVAGSADNGHTWMDPKLLSDDVTINNNDTPRITTDGNGQWVVIWCSNYDLNGTLGTDSDIFISHYRDTTPPLAGSVISDAGSYTSDNKKLSFHWSGFAEDDLASGIASYEVAFGSGINAELYQPFTSFGLDRNKTFLAEDFPQDFPGGVFPVSEYTCTARAVNGMGLKSDAVSATVTVDSSAPVPGNVISDAGPYTTNNTQLVFSWTPFSDAGSGVVDYEVAFGNDSDHEAYQAFTPVGLVFTKIMQPGDFPSHFPGGTFADGTYICSVRAIDAVGLISPVESAGVVVDLSEPLAGTVTFSSDPNRSETLLSFSWSGFSDPHSGIGYYEVAFGDDTDPYVYQDFTAAGSATSATFIPQDFPDDFPIGIFPDRQYVCTVRAVNRVGMTSASSSGQFVVDFSPPEVGTVFCDAGGQTFNAKQLSFSWSGFNEPHTEIAYYEVALGNESDPEAYRSFTHEGLSNSIIFLPNDPSLHYHFPDGVFYDDSPDGVYVCTVRAVNTATLTSNEVSASVQVIVTRPRLGQEIVGPVGANVATTTWEGVDVFRVDHAERIFTRDWGSFYNIDWDLGGQTDTRTYFNLQEPVQEAMVIYHTYAATTATLAPQVDLSLIAKVTIHHNRQIPYVDDATPGKDNSYLWIQDNMLNARETTGMVVLQYDNHPEPHLPEHFVGVELVDIRYYNPDPVVDPATVYIGSRPLPLRNVSNKVAPIVTRGGAGSTTVFIYQHEVEGSPQKGQVWVLRPNDDSRNMEIVWVRTGLGGIKWPYELSRYTSEWPENEPSKYQQFVRGDAAASLGPKVTIPLALNPELMEYEEFGTPTHHAHLDGNNSFDADGAGWALLKYQTGPIPGQDWVGFEVVRCVLHTDSGLFDLTPVQWEVGQEIIDAYHEGPLPGNIHEGERYAEGIYDETGQIFGVNKEMFEIWWSNLSRTQDPEGPSWPSWPADPAKRVQWPSKVVRYNAVWPASPEKIVIARQNGTGVIDPAVYGTDWDIYIQNDPGQLGFNPNDEHAIKALYSTGWAIFALRDDLGTPETSDPYVLMKYKEQPGNELWRFRMFKVLREEAPYFFGDWANLSNDPESPLYNPAHDPSSDPYEGEAGKLIQAPFPLSTLDYCNETTGVSGPVFEDKTSRHWATAAGNTGGTAQIVMRYYYPVQENFFFPTGTYAVDDHVPWLDAGTGTPLNVTYTISWPKAIPVMKIGQTLIEAMYGLPAIAGQASVDIIYEQSVETGGGPSVMLIDPIRTRQEVDLSSLPGDIHAEPQGTEMVFTELSLALRMRTSYDPVRQRLKFKGILLDPVTGYDYALLNVMSSRERDELLSLSGNAQWQSAVNDLYNGAKDPARIEDSSVDPYDMLALTSGFAEGVGYVTLAMQNAEQAGDLPVSLEIIEVVPELDPGEILVITPSCPFDETLTLRHRGDFGGRTDLYEFEWLYYPDEDGTIPSVPYADWFTVGSGGQGAVDITIKGPGLLTLSDNWLVCRYKYTGAGLPWSNEWSDWAPPQLAEGWIKRVIGEINPFTQRASGGGIEGAENAVSSYEDMEINTVVSMVSQAGARWTGSVPMNCSNLDGIGLVEIYETVLNRGVDLSIEGIPPVNYPPANTALLLVASRIADLYMLLGNEAYADAADPTIAFGTDDGQYGAEASSVHCFMNTTSSLLEEELALLRGRDDSVSPGVRVHPIYNRLIWNFTKDITGGEVAYALNYNIQDENGNANGVISEADAKALYPQGHGDAWGHYLTAIKTYYRLLRHPNYTWNSRSEGILVAGQPVTVDYLDERKFAAAAAAKARTGAEIVNLRYRSAYVENPAGQWQGYRDVDPERAWGLSEWAGRSGQGAYLDWVVGNAILPADDNQHTGIQKIDRTTVVELREVASRSQEIQAQLDMADLGLNPLGLATNVVPFDISPSEIDAGKTHFEQIYDRAVTAMNNAITVFNYANNSTQLLRRQADTLTEFQQMVEEREVDFRNRLIEIFGYPYADDIGAGKTYPSGYEGPDIYHYTYVDPSQLIGVERPQVKEIALNVTGFEVQADGSLVDTEKTVVFHFATSADRYGLVKPPTWVGERRAPGEIQMARSDLIQARARFERALSEYNLLIAQIENQAKLIEAQHDVNAEVIRVLNAQVNEQGRLNDLIKESHSRQLDFNARARFAVTVANALAEALPLSAGWSFDLTSTIRSAIRFAGAIEGERFTHDADRETLAALDHQQAAQTMQAQTNIVLTTLQQEFAILQQVKQLEQLVRQEISARLELYTMQEALQQASGRYLAALAQGQRLLEDRSRFRRQTAAEVQSRRYKDMAFRIFRNDALQKYRAQFDLAARYVYLAAKAYDFETTFLSSDLKAGQRFLANIVRARLIGTIQGGLPQTGMGLADAMARMSQNFQILKGQLGFNNPQQETNRFSLRSELFRIQPGFAGNTVWRQTLWHYVVPNLLELAEFQRYARIFQPYQSVEPGIVIPFETNINFGQNFFGWPLGGGDSAYDSTNFTTKVRSVGVWFSNYDTLVSGGMSNTPRVYLIPVGSDVQRSPTGYSGETREFKILDQVLPLPYTIGGGDLTTSEWIPIVDTLTDTFAAVRRYPSFRAYHDSGSLSPSEVVRDSRLIGRSVWNTRWLLIIPAGSFLFDREEGLKRFIDGRLIGDQRDGNGVSDIKIFFETYAYPGY